MPVRHEDDFRRKPIKDWDTYIEEEIVAAQERGEFADNLYAGQPIKIETNPLAPDLDFAFSRLKNAGYKPTWMELDEEIAGLQAELQRFLKDNLAFAHRLLDRLQEDRGIDPALRPIPRQSWWNRLIHGPRRVLERNEGPESIAELREIAQTMRAQYLERSALLDKRIAEFNAALGRELWHLERIRLTQERAARRFEEAFAPLLQHIGPFA